MIRYNKSTNSYISNLSCISVRITKLADNLVSSIGGNAQEYMTSEIKEAKIPVISQLIRNCFIDINGPVSVRGTDRSMYKMLFDINDIDWRIIWREGDGSKGIFIIDKLPTGEELIKFQVENKLSITEFEFPDMSNTIFTTATGKFYNEYHKYHDSKQNKQ